MINNKITIIGIGNVGSIIAYNLYSCSYIDEIALIDTTEKRQKIDSEILDIIHGLPLQHANKIYRGSYSDCYDSKIIIISAGHSRNVNQSRLDLFEENSKIVNDVITKIKPHYNGSIIVLLTNPNDILTHQIYCMNIFPHNKIFSTGCMLDSSRFVSQIAGRFNLKNEDVKGYVVGEHGDKQLILWSQLEIQGENISEYCKRNNIILTNEIKKDIGLKNKSYGVRIIEGKHHTTYGIASCISFLVNSIIINKEIIVSVCCEMLGEFDISNVALSLPTIINQDGINQRKIDKITEIEIEHLRNTSNSLKQFMR